MAVGDDAAAAGYPLVPNTGEEGKVRWGAREINRTRDFVAQVKNTVLGTIWPIALGGTGAVSAAAARTNLGAAAAVHGHTSEQVSVAEAVVPDFVPGASTTLSIVLQNIVNKILDVDSEIPDVPSGGNAVGDLGGGHIIGFYWNGTRPVIRIDHTTDIALAPDSSLAGLNSAITTMAGGSVSGKANAFESIGNVRSARGPDGTAYGRNAGSNRFAVYMDDGLEFGRNVSSRRYKEDIESIEVDPKDVLALVPRTYHRKTDAPDIREFGLIAEEVHETLPEIVTFFPDEAGVPQIDGVNYELLSVALLAVVKDQQKRIEALEQKLS